MNILIIRNLLFISSKFKFGDKIYFNLNTTEMNNPYKQNDRLFPVEFEFPFSSQISYIIAVPNGYVTKELPKSIAISLPNNAGKFIYYITFSANQLSIIIKQDISIPILPKEYYTYLKELYNQIIIDK